MPILIALPQLPINIYARAVDARDARFDGIFFVGITTTRVYCRPVCASRLAQNNHRRFFPSAAAAERAGFRPCLRCRPELAPGHAPVDAVSRLAHAAAHRIGAGALNGHSVTELAHDLGVTARHLRRALERALGVSPVELAQTHRLLLAKRLLADTTLSVTQVADASGFQSLRRFNAAFLEQYRIPPSVLRRAPRCARTTEASDPSIRSRREPSDEYLRLTLAYRAPLAWGLLVACLAQDAIAGVEVIDGRRYGRTISVEGRTGTVFAEDASRGTVRTSRKQPTETHLNVDVSLSLLPVLMPLLARLRRLFDLDAEPMMIDAHLAQSGLASCVARWPGVRIPGAVDGFDIALRALLRGRGRVGHIDTVCRADPFSSDPTYRVAWTLGEPIETGMPALKRLAPSASRVAEAGSTYLVALGIPQRRADAAVTVARLVADGKLRLEPLADVGATHRALTEVAGVGDQIATLIVTRALNWPDALSAADCALQRGAGVSTARALVMRAERWRPWRAYAALHLWLQDDTLRAARTSANRLDAAGATSATMSAATSTAASNAASIAV